MKQPMAWSGSVVALALIAILTVSPAAFGQNRPETGSPFDGVRWNEFTPEVLVDGEWYGLVSIDGLPTEKIVAYCREQYKDIAIKRFEEDLIEVMGRMGSPPGKAVRLVMRRPDGGEVVVEKAELSDDKRDALRDAARARGGAMTAPMARERAEKAVDELARVLAERHSYAAARGYDASAAANKAKASFGDMMAAEDVAAACAAMVMPIGDAHSSVSGGMWPERPPFLPVLLAPLGSERGGPIVAFRADREGLVDEAFPFVEAIDGVVIERWIEASAASVPAASPQLVQERACRALRSITVWRKGAGVAAASATKAVLKLRSADGRTRERTVTLAASKPTYGEWPNSATHMLGEGVGYLRLASMGDGDEFLKTLRAEFEGLRGAKALVIDLRGNGGGMRDAVFELARFLLAPDEGPVVFNASRPRLLPGDTDKSIAGRMSSRFLFTESDPRWSDAERAAIVRFREGFKPEITLPDALFGPWHYAVASPGPDGPPPFRGQVAVLIDEGCFSACDVAASALRAMADRRPGLKLVGGPTAGGSGLSERYTIAGGLVNVRLSTMVSFQHDGMLFDGRGVPPHVSVDRIPTDFTVQSDSVLAAAVELLR